jgi:hypothetical protein
MERALLDRGCAAAKHVDICITLPYPPDANTLVVQAKEKIGPIVMRNRKSTPQHKWMAGPRAWEVKT